ncbi:hypothetical protein L873DRAFT_1802382 [Choiromyces venosus 120613-1]|uniref:ATP synthase F0 subunit 8 n=1 Tax=Choiromyces venosus 120613-1 TaxID=1336337 RepID=A0A3N4JW51_9PEZI|nr:hypothetical protein L873DRAFT_1802382 [Choiromyces venosus 120613-1]
MINHCPAFIFFIFVFVFSFLVYLTNFMQGTAKTSSGAFSKSQDSPSGPSLFQIC